MAAGETKKTTRAVRVGSGGLGEAGEGGIFWSDDGALLVLQLFSDDSKDRWLAGVALAEGKLLPLERFTDEAWINWSHNEAGFLSDSSTLHFTSDQSGHSQLYTRSVTSGERKRLTDGEFVVSDERSDLVDGTIGEGSPFHDLYGYYAQGVDEKTAVLPRGWKKRLVAVRNENTRGNTGWCLEPHDLVVAKTVAGREKHLLFLREAARSRLVDREKLLERLAGTDLDERLRAQVAARLNRAFEA